jgi:uncharacterized protein
MDQPDVTKKTIWIDLDNSPHVPLFAPVIRHYRKNGIDVTLTARDHSQTVELLDLHGFHGMYKIIGRHYGAGKLNKAFGLVVRAMQLRSYIHTTQRTISVAVSHGSRSMVLAAWWLRIPVITMYDYEHTETRIFNHLSTRVLVPDQIPDSVLDNIGLATGKRVKYAGLKEELYVNSFAPDPEFRSRFLEKHGRTEKDEILAVLRPPASTANYHSTRSDELFDSVLQYLLNVHGVFTVIIPRDAEQAGEIRNIVAGHPDGSNRSVILDEAVDGLNLAAAADLVVSGGGTMNREAVLLGVPVYSIFAGEVGALDAQMESSRAITFIRETGDVSRIALERKTAPLLRSREDRLTGGVETTLREQIDSFLSKD